MVGPHNGTSVVIRRERKNSMLSLSLSCEDTARRRTEQNDLCGKAAIMLLVAAEFRTKSLLSVFAYNFLSLL